MPTTDIIGYLWLRRQDLDLYSLPDVLDMVANLQRLGVDGVRAEDVSVLGTTVDVSVQLVRKPVEEWDAIVHDTLLNAAVENAAHLFHEGSDGE